MTPTQPTQKLDKAGQNLGPLAPSELPLGDATKGIQYWTLYYRFGSVPHAQKSFPFNGTMSEAIFRCRKHCEIMGLRYICVRPLIVDLDYQEKLYLDGKFNNDEMR